MAFLLFAAESVFLVLASLVFPHQHTAESEALVWKSPWQALRRDETTWRGLLDFRVASVLLVVTMVALYAWFSDDTEYLPFGGKVTLDGRPVVGAVVVLDTDRDVLDAELPTGPDGRYEFGTKQRAGGAPAGARYRVRVEPRWDYLVRVDSDGAGEAETVLAAVPAGTNIEQLTAGNTRRFVLAAANPQTIVVEAHTKVEIRRATSVPEKYRNIETSGLEIRVPEQPRPCDLRLDSGRGPAQQ